MAAMALTGCLNQSVSIPHAYLPMQGSAADDRTAKVMMPDAVALGAAPPPQPVDPPKDPTKKGVKPFELPPDLPGAGTSIAKPPKFTKDTPAVERLKLVLEGYPGLQPAAAMTMPTGTALTLADLQRMAMTSSPVIKKAQADAQAAYGQVVQAGLHPNPTIGYEADQWQPGSNPDKHNDGQQGGFVNQLIKFPGKLSLAQAVAGFDYMNSHVAVRRAEVDVTAAVRSNYFQVLIAQKSIEVNRSLVALSDEVYQLQLKQVAAGEAAGYEPLQLYAQALQARNGLAQAEISYRANWRQLTAALGQPDLPLAPLSGRVDLPIPVVDPEAARARIVENHTDILTARNRILQAQVNLRLQYLNRVPDLLTNTVVQYDTAAKNPQFGLQLGIPVPLFDRNQGNIRSAQFQIASSNAALTAAQNDLLSRLADATSRYEANRLYVESYRDKILPALSQGYQGLIRRYQQEPADLPAGGKVAFNDIVVAQQNLAQALQAYLTALGAQWQAVVDLANLLQVDELYSGQPPVEPEKPEKPPEKK
jgi:outer membrane protein, heavy metal efflux system